MIKKKQNKKKLMRFIFEGQITNSSSDSITVTVNENLSWKKNFHGLYRSMKNFFHEISHHVMCPLVSLWPSTKYTCYMHIYCKHIVQHRDPYYCTIVKYAIANIGSSSLSSYQYSS